MDSYNIIEAQNYNNQEGLTEMKTVGASIDLVAHFTDKFQFLRQLDLLSISTIHVKLNSCSLSQMNQSSWILSKNLNNY